MDTHELYIKLTLRHEDLTEKDIRKDEGKLVGFNNGWPAIISELKRKEVYK